MYRSNITYQIKHKVILIQENSHQSVCPSACPLVLTYTIMVFFWILYLKSERSHIKNTNKSLNLMMLVCIYLTGLPVYPSIHLSVCTSVHPSMHPLFHLSLKTAAHAFVQDLQLDIGNTNCGLTEFFLLCKSAGVGQLRQGTRKI